MQNSLKAIGDIGLGVILVSLLILVLTVLAVAGFLRIPGLTLVGCEDKQIASFEPLVQESLIGSPDLTRKLLVDSSCTEYIRAEKNKYYIKFKDEEKEREFPTLGVEIVMPTGKLFPRESNYEVRITAKKVEIQK